MTENPFTQKMMAKTTLELETILENKAMYEGDAIIAATLELEKRRFEERHSSTGDAEVHEGSGYTNDPSAPELYPRWSIWFVSLSFNLLFAGFMMAKNLKWTDNKGQSTNALLFSVVFTTLAWYATNYLIAELHAPIWTLNGFNLLGGYLLLEYFWDGKIGQLKYRRRSPVIPILISLVVSVIISMGLLWVATRG